MANGPVQDVAALLIAATSFQVFSRCFFSAASYCSSLRAQYAAEAGVLVQVFLLEGVLRRTIEHLRAPLPRRIFSPDSV
jgi:hypothetical protein